MSRRPRNPEVSAEKVRHLSAEELGVAPPAVAPPPVPDPAGLEPLDADDPLLETVRDLLTTWGGVVFSGPPGTSKSYYASRIGFTLVDGDVSRLRLVQFHPSYQYEDFVEGYVPNENGVGFTLKPKHFLDMCKAAVDHPNELVVLVIDELSRGDPGRVFGEALTYVEKTKRLMKFFLSSGKECSVPENLVVLATMNPLDRGVDEVDAALERRFAKIAMDPSVELLDRMLADAGMDDDLRKRVAGFFTAINDRATANPHAAMGHTYFLGIKDTDGLRRVWEHQLRFHFDKAYRLDPEGLADVYSRWDRVLGMQVAAGAAEPEANGEGPAVEGGAGEAVPPQAAPVEPEVGEVTAEEAGEPI